MSRRAKIATALCAGAAASAGGVYLASSDKRQAIDWTLIGTEERGRVLVVGFADTYRGCTRSPRARVLGRTLGSVDLQVTAKGSKCQKQAAALLRPIRVRLDAPLDGQTVRGRSKSTRRLPATNATRWGLNDPEVIGLMPGDAAGVAMAFNLRYREIGPDHAVGYLPVTAQRRVGNVLEVETRGSKH